MAERHGRNEWLSENAYRAFPFVEDSSFVADDGVAMPLAVVRDFRCVWVPRARQRQGDHPPFRVSLSSFSISRESDAGSGLFRVSASFSMSSGFDGGRCEVSLSAGGIGPGCFSMAMSSVHEPDAGLLGHAEVMCVLGVPVGFGGAVAEVSGTHRFSAGPEVLCSRTVFVPGGFGADSISMESDDREPKASRGVVHVRDGLNTRFYIRRGELYLEVGNGFGAGYDCPEVMNECVNLHFINGQRAGSDGDFQIVGGDGVVVGSGDFNGIPAVTVTTSSSVNEFAMPRVSMG